MNLLILKARKEVAQNGLDLLRSKREALVREFLAVTDKVISTRDQLRNTMQGAMNALSVALGMDGRAVVESTAMATRREFPVDLIEKNVWGVRFPDIEYQAVIRSVEARNYAFSGVSSYINASAREFEKTLDVVLRIISVETRLKKIGNEIRKTTRRVNALTEVILPELKGQMRGIQYALATGEWEQLCAFQNDSLMNWLKRAIGWWMICQGSITAWHSVSFASISESHGQLRKFDSNMNLILSC